MRKLSISIAIGVCFLLTPVFADAQDSVAEHPVSAAEWAPKVTPQMWSLELKTGFWLPQNAVLKDFFTNCCNMISGLEGGLLLRRRYGVYQSVAFMYKTAQALGVLSGLPSSDRFNFLLIPMNTSFVWRADYFDWRYLVPFARAGIDYVFYREGDVGGSTKGVKFGIDGGGGVALNIGLLGDANMAMDSELGVNDLFMTFEARYQWINNFGGKGIDLSGGLYSVGLLFEF